MTTTSPQTELGSLALLTDLYQLTMAYAYWKSGFDSKEAVFHLTFRHHPFKGGYTIACGLHDAIGLLDKYGFDESDLDYLGQLRGNDNRPLFETGFLDYLRNLRFSCDVDAVPEGTVMFPHEPLIRIRGPIVQAQLLETPLLNLINFQSLIATKAARICHAAQGQAVVEFGLRRAQGLNGALTASRAAYIGGCDATSNLLAGKLFGIPVKGTHAHSWVMSFDSELESFRSYAEALPNNSVFLVDTYDTLEGVRRAVEVGRWLRSQGSEMIGIRLDSGDLAYLSKEARKILDAAGFPKAIIVASNDLDEQIITSLKSEGAAIDVWGVGTKMITAHDQPALGGVYKLGAIRRHGSAWEYKVKLSEQAVKTSNPGILQVRRFQTGAEYLADVIYDVEQGIQDACTMVDPVDATRRKSISAGTPHTELLVPVFRGGKCVYDCPSPAAVRSYAAAQLTGFHEGIKRHLNPHQYPVGLESGLHQLKTELILKARGNTP